MSLAYFTAPISDNLEETPEGYLLARDCVLGRTGFQKYSLSELPEKYLEELGIDASNPSASLKVYRPADEVFHPDTLSSGNLKPVTDGHPDPNVSDDGFVSPEFYSKLSKGTVNDLRQGDEPLEDGEFPIRGDVLIMGEPLLTKVRNKEVRELSLGYDYALRRNGDRIEQCNILINHLAVVPKGRAGPEARINDAMPPAAEEQGPPLPKSTTTREKRPVKNTLLHLLGIGLMEKAKAADADPEELAQAAMEIGKHQEPKAEDSQHAKDKFAHVHDHLSSLLEKHGKDSNIDGLKSHLDKFFSEEKKEPEHQEDEEPESISTKELDEVLAADKHGKDEEEDEEIAEDEESDDDEEEIGEVTEENGEEKDFAGDRHRAADGVAAVLKTLRPVIARTKDEKVKSAFNATLRSLTQASKTSSGNRYGEFASRARSRDSKNLPAKRVKAADAEQDRERKLQEYYNNAQKGGK